MHLNAKLIRITSEALGSLIEAQNKNGAERSSWSFYCCAGSLCLLCTLEATGINLPVTAVNFTVLSLVLEAVNRLKTKNSELWRHSLIGTEHSEGGREDRRGSREGKETPQ